MKCKEVSREMVVLMLQRVSSQVAGFCGAVAVSLGKAAKLSLSKAFKQVVISFAWQAWHFLTFRRVSSCVKSRFVWQAQHFCVLVRR